MEEETDLQTAIAGHEEEVPAGQGRGIKEWTGAGTSQEPQSYGTPASVACGRVVVVHVLMMYQLYPAGAECCRAL